jgi:gamma-glutamyl-gamma-aminobutyrate hydrolase PuuD/ubiquinone/menaquinone biosynthesis C-methylase UbiE
MRKPLVAITSDLDVTHYVLRTNYVGMVVAAGGLPAILPPVAELAEEQAGRYDAFILTGGDDIDPSGSGEELHPSACVMDPRRQAGELALLRALDSSPQVPVLGICLGMQFLCIHNGGRLHQHLPDVVPGAERHIGNRIHRVAGHFEGEVTSQHHQGVADPGRLEVIARAEDGVIEAVRDPARHHYLGVQWHPERTLDPALGIGIFQRLLEAARGARILVIALLLALGAGCRSTSTAPGREASVRPGINDPYFADPRAEAWVARFEVESREIWKRREEIVAAVGVRPGWSVADIGAGSGFFSRLFAQRVGPEGRVHAVDIVPEFLEHIRARAAEDGLRWIRCVQGREDSAGLDPASIDLAFVCDTYHHFEYPRSMLASIHEALRPGGELVVIDFIRIEGKSRPWILEHVRAGEDVVRAEIEAAGFTVVERRAFLEENWFLRFRRRD